MPLQRNILCLLAKTLQNKGAENKPDLLHIFSFVRDCAEQVAAGREEGRAHAGRALEDELIFAQAMANSGNTIDVLGDSRNNAISSTINISLSAGNRLLKPETGREKGLPFSCSVCGETRIRLIVLAGNQEQIILTSHPTRSNFANKRVITHDHNDDDENNYFNIVMIVIIYNYQIWLKIYFGFWII